MDIKQSFFTAIRNLCVHKARFAQVMLSMVVGVAAVVVICNTCRVMVRQVEESWAPELYSIINMYINNRADNSRRATIEDLERIAMENPEILLAVSPYVTNSDMTGNVRFGDKYYKEGYFIGVNESYADMQMIKMAAGRFIDYMDCRREQNVCVVSRDVANKLMGGDALGQTLNIWGLNYTVIGVMQDDTPGLMYLPYTCAQKLVGDRTTTGYNGDKYYVNRFEVQANGVDNIRNAQTLITEEMNKLLGANRGDWSLNAASYLFVKQSIIGYCVSQAYNYMLMVLAVLLVGGVGIMNVMLAAVEERRQEIGIRKAFGATNRDIQRQFRMEAVLTSLAGGVVGVVLGVILSFSLPWLVSDIVLGSGMSLATGYLDISLGAWPILLALGLALGVGVIFGVYPAQQAAKMEPVAAINAA